MLEEGTTGAPSTARIIRDGFVVGILNPKGIVFNAAVTPQFIDRGDGRRDCSANSFRRNLRAPGIRL